MTFTSNQTFQELHHKILWEHSRLNQISKCSTQKCSFNQKEHSFFFSHFWNGMSSHSSYLPFPWIRHWSHVFHITKGFKYIVSRVNLQIWKYSGKVNESSLVNIVVDLDMKSGSEHILCALLYFAANSDHPVNTR